MASLYFQGTNIIQYCTCPAGWVTYNFHSSYKHTHLSFKSVCNKEHKGVICKMTSSSNSSQSTRVGWVLWEDLLLLSRFHSLLWADGWNFCPLILIVQIEELHCTFVPEDLVISAGADELLFYDISSEFPQLINDKYVCFISVNSYGHVEMVSSPNQTFS